MAVSYNEGLTDDISIIRFYVGDTVANAGPRPGDKNYSDAEITALLGLRSNNTGAVISNLFDALASEWTKYATSITVGPRKEELYRISEMYAKKAREWAATSGVLYTTFSGGLVRREASDGSEHTA